MTPAAMLEQATTYIDAAAHAAHAADTTAVYHITVDAVGINMTVVHSHAAAKAYVQEKVDEAAARRWPVNGVRVEARLEQATYGKVRS